MAKLGIVDWDDQLIDVIDVPENEKKTTDWTVGLADNTDLHQFCGQGWKFNRETGRWSSPMPDFATTLDGAVIGTCLQFWLDRKAKGEAINHNWLAILDKTFNRK